MLNRQVVQRDRAVVQILTSDIGTNLAEIFGKHPLEMEEIIAFDYILQLYYTNNHPCFMLTSIVSQWLKVIYDVYFNLQL